MTQHFGKKRSLGATDEPAAAASPLRVRQPAVAEAPEQAAKTPFAQAADIIREQILLRTEPLAAVRMNREQLTAFVNGLVTEVAQEQALLLNLDEQNELAVTIVNEMIGLGPVEPLLQDPSVSDILINGPRMVYVERKGKLELTGLHFRDNAHVLHVAQRIAASVGRSVDEANPMLDARLTDGSRVNVILPPLSLRGPCISIRKFARSMMDFSKFAASGTLSEPMARALEIAARCRLNIIVSGGTGSGKTTMLNALSAMIAPAERVVTIEDAAELQLQHEHVVQLETRPANLEGQGMIDQRALVRNALRMRPDRIIIGEVRGAEAFDMMQAMNTGHSGSMSTIHANSARDALARIESMILMANLNLPAHAIRGQIASALDLIVHMERMRDGVRRVTEVVEVVGMEEDVITLNTLFCFRYAGESAGGALAGAFEAVPCRPRFLPRIEYFGLAGAFRDALGGSGSGE